MRKKSLLLIFLMLFVGITTYAEDTDISTLDNVVYIESGKNVTIGSDGNAVIPINMKNSVGITGFQFYLTLPSGVSASEVTLTKSTSRKAEDVSFSEATQADGRIKVVCYTTDDNEFSGNDGEIATITISNAISANYEFGMSSIELSSHGTPIRTDEVITSTVKLDDHVFDKGYVVKVNPFKLDPSEESVSPSIVLNIEDGYPGIKTISFDAQFNNVEFQENAMHEASVTPLSGRGKSSSCVSNQDSFGSYTFNLSNTAGITGGYELGSLTLYSESMDGSYIIPNGKYTLTISNLNITDLEGKVFQDFETYNVDFYVGSSVPEATVENGKVSFAGDYSDTEAAELLEAAMPKDDETVTAVDLTGVTALPEGTTITTANPNAIIYTSTDLNLSNTTNVVVNSTCDNLVLQDGKPFAAENKFIATNATYTRDNVTSTYGTICLPYAVQSDANIQYYQLDEFTGSSLSLVAVNEVPAGVPAIFKKLSVGQTISASSASVAVKSNLSDDAITNLKLVGTFVDLRFTENLNKLYCISNNCFIQGRNSMTIKAFRAYLEAVSGNNAKKIAIGNNDVTAIEAIFGENNAAMVEGYYNTNGVQINELQKGINIIKLKNGTTKKLIIK